MILGIMQPYFLPYIGYFQLIHSCDCFVIYDNIQYTKKGWINRNRYLLNGKDALFSLSLVKGHDYLNVNERFLSQEHKREKLLSCMQNAYAKAPNIKKILPLIADIINCPEENLFKYVYYSVISICEYLDIKTNIVVSSQIEIDHSLKSEQKVIAICKALEASVYINPIGGMELYQRESFTREGISLKFIKTNPIEYKQFGNAFVPWLFIIDVLMFNDKQTVQAMLNEYTLI
jgi:hypothetical protein